MLRSTALCLVVLVAPAPCFAQGTPLIPVPARPVPDEEDDLDEEGADPDEEAGEEGSDGAGPREGETIDEGMELPPIPDEPPQFRLRAGGGVALATAGETRPLVRLTQDFEIQLNDIAPFYFGVGGGEVLAGAFVIGTLGANLGLAAWVAQDPAFRLQGAIHLHIGASFGGGFVSPDIAGEVDLRLLTGDDFLELHLRGGFFTLSGVTYIDITAGVGLAF